MARGSHRWSVVVEEKVGDVRGGFKGRDGGKNVCFTMLDVFVACKTRLGQNLAHLGKFFSNKFYYFGENIICHTLDVIFQITSIKTCRVGLQAYNPNVKAIQRLTNPGLRF